MALILIALLILGVIGIVSYFVSAKAYAGLQRNKNEYARVIQVVIFLVCFALLGFLTIYLIVSNIHLER
jgi:phosphate starvation-inducible membrane PsiE